MRPRHDTSTRRFRVLVVCSALTVFGALQHTVLRAQDIQAVGARLQAAGEKTKASVRNEQIAETDRPFVVLARWHKAKERILTRAVADGEITEAEADYLRVQIVKAEAAETAANPRKEGRASRVTAAQIIRSMDANDDGKIARSEATEELALFFDEYDLDENGVLDRAEAEAIAAYANRHQTVRPDGSPGE